jgi:hypothetical protein
MRFQTVIEHEALHMLSFDLQHWFIFIWQMWLTGWLKSRVTHLWDSDILLTYFNFIEVPVILQCMHYLRMLNVTSSSLQQMVTQYRSLSLMACHKSDLWDNVLAKLGELSHCRDKPVGWITGFWFPAETGIFFSLSRVDWLWGPLSLLSNGL